MEIANDVVVRFMPNHERRKHSMAAPGNCAALVSDALPPQTRIMSTIRNELCPDSRCSDVDRAILGASIGG